MEKIVTSQSVEKTIDLGRALGRALSANTIIALIGNLGTGKTHFIKGLALGLDVPDPESVTSPTFTLINEYEGRLPLYHIDAYRFDNPWQLESLGFDELCTAGGVVVVEWADRVEPLIMPCRPVMVELFHQGPQSRQIKISQLDRNLLEKMDTLP